MTTNGNAGNGARIDEPGRDAVELIRADHRRLLILLERLLTPELWDGFEDDLAQAIAGIEAHADAEEQLLYPALAEARPGYGPLAEALNAHQAIEDELQALDEIDIGDDELQPTLHRLHDLLQQHIADEESYLLGMVRQHVSAETCRALARHFVELEAEDEGVSVDRVEADLARGERDAPQPWSGADDPGM